MSHRRLLLDVTLELKFSRSEKYKHLLIHPLLNGENGKELREGNGIYIYMYMYMYMSILGSVI
jgi:hypothetical protein